MAAEPWRPRVSDRAGSRPTDVAPKRRPIARLVIDVPPRPRPAPPPPAPRASEAYDPAVLDAMAGVGWARRDDHALGGWSLTAAGRWHYWRWVARRAKERT